MHTLYEYNRRWQFKVVAGSTDPVPRMVKPSSSLKGGLISSPKEPKDKDANRSSWSAVACSSQISEMISSDVTPGQIIVS